MIVPGALTGSRAPYSGRTTIHAFSPQAWPYNWFTRSSIGMHFGGELKRAGYDALIVSGAAETPVQIRIRDDEVSILPADDLWGLDTMDSLEALDAGEGGKVRALVIGPAGERLSRIVTIRTASSSAAGQGGFGGVMGSKKLKAISVIGTRRVKLAYPDKVTSLACALSAVRRHGPAFFGWDLDRLNRQLAREGSGRAHLRGCTEGCVTPCFSYFDRVPGVVHDRQWSGGWFCIATIFRGIPTAAPGAWRDIFGWRLGQRAAFEMNVLSNRYGLNQFDLLGMVAWLSACQREGLIATLNGCAMDWCSPHFWDTFLRAVAYREGLGDALAEGTWRAARHLQLGEHLAARLYAGWGYCGHHDGHAISTVVFPYWLVAALQWMADTRDPFDSGHGFLHALAGYNRLIWAKTEDERRNILVQLRALGERAYGDINALDPYSGYAGKAYPAFFHMVRAVLVDIIPVDDFVFPLVADPLAPERYCVLHNVEGYGDIEGPMLENYLFCAGTGLDWSSQELEHTAQRVCALERALQVRHWARDRALDESLLPYFEQPEIVANPLLGERKGLDREQFMPVLTEFYRLHGWDMNGRPTRERLDDLDLKDVYEPMMAGATLSNQKVGSSNALMAPTCSAADKEATS